MSETAFRLIEGAKSYLFFEKRLATGREDGAVSCTAYRANEQSGAKL